MPLDFSEFPPVSKKAWLEQVAKDLKDKPLDSLYWQPTEELIISPLLHAEDFPESPAPLSLAPGTCAICEDLEAADPQSANRQALQALEFGAEALHFRLSDTADAGYLRQLLAGVYLDFVGLHFSGPAVGSNPGVLLAALQQIAVAQGLASTQLHGSVHYDPVGGATLVDWRYLGDLIAFARTDFPGFRLVGIDAGERADPVEQLVSLLQQGNFYLQKLTERGLSAREVAGVLHFQMDVGKSYFLEIAKIRAFKTLWLNVLQAWQAPLEYPQLSAVFLPAAYADDLYTNMVRGTTMAMSAVIGGVDRLTVRPYAVGREDQASYPPEFGRRIARNVQHLLSMESGFDQLTDPAAGSYYLENLTAQLSQVAWAKFSNPTDK